MRSAFVLAAAAASLGLTPMMRSIHEHGRAPPRRIWTGKIYTPNGKREVARRLRQIRAGKLKVSNAVD